MLSMLKKGLPVFVLLLFSIITFLTTLDAHPHIFIKPSLKLYFNQNMLRSVKVIWRWDEYWSLDVMEECDKNGDGALSDQEVSLVYKDFFAAIKDYDYFTKLTIDGSPVSGFEVSLEDFNAYINIEEGKKILYYEFVIPVQRAALEKEISVVFADRTIYTAFSPGGFSLELNDSSLSVVDQRVEREGYCGTRAEFLIMPAK
jgi:ABC-type uncharacterized transport system substrate-binding protein